MKKIAVMNYKGGVGKTSLTVNLAAQLGWMGYKVLLLDMDAQASLTFSLIKPETWLENFAEEKTIKRWFDAVTSHKTFDLSSLIYSPERLNKTVKENNSRGCVDLIPSHLGLINVDLELATQLAGGTLSQAKQNYLKVHRRLAEGLAAIPEKSYDVVLFDCPPNFNVVTKNAIVASDAILVPAKPDYLSTLGIDYLTRSVKDLVRDYNEYASHGDDKSPDLKTGILGVVFTMLNIRSGGAISALRPFIAQTKALGVPVFDQHLRENKTLYADVMTYGLPVVLRHTTNPSHKVVIQELETLTDEFAKKIGLSQTPKK